MNQNISNNTKNWNPKCSISFATWYKEHVKSHFDLDEDYILLKTNL